MDEVGRIWNKDIEPSIQTATMITALGFVMNIGAILVRQSFEDDITTMRKSENGSGLQFHSSG
jgi:hypothetical protein